MNEIYRLKKFYEEYCEKNTLPQAHVEYLLKLKSEGFDPRVIYDIGSSTLHWAMHAKKVWPKAEIILFEANPLCEFLYKNYKYNIGMLSNKRNEIKKFYLNEYSPGGSSYYREVGFSISNKLYPVNRYYEMTSETLDDVVEKKCFPLPDLVKIDVQGAERDIMEGGINTLKHARRLLLEIPHKGIVLNEGAPTYSETLQFVESQGWTCCDPLFCNNGTFDGDYGFTRDLTP